MHSQDIWYEKSQAYSYEINEWNGCLLVLPLSLSNFFEHDDSITYRVANLLRNDENKSTQYECNPRAFHRNYELTLNHMIDAQFLLAPDKVKMLSHSWQHKRIVEFHLVPLLKHMLACKTGLSE